MSKNFDNRYFIILNKDKIIFSCLNNENKNLFTQKYDFINFDSNELFKEVENFFNDNLVKIEKKLKDFIRKIYIIVDLDNSLSVNLSIKYDLDKAKIKRDKINELINTLKYQFNKYYNDEKIIHIIVNKLIVDGEKKNLLPVKENFQNLIIEVKFQCLKEQFVNNIKKSLSNYQIAVEKIFLADRLNKNIQNQEENIFEAADKVLSEEDSDEVLIVKKKKLNNGFFERFFNFFN
jgi:hypothetical protein